MFTFDRSGLTEMLKQLDQARRAHTEWYDNLVGTLLCASAADASKLHDAGHCACGFGCWYHEKASNELRQQPEFQAIDADNRRLHSLGTKLLQAVARGAPVARKDFDELTEVRLRLHLALDCLRHEIQAALADSDPLTGAYERGALARELREWHELVKRGVQECCIAFLDLDHFKEINDTHGHIVGDRVLAGAARCITGQLRPYDKLFRYGGDEFLILLPAVDLAAARRVIDRIREKLAATPLVSGERGASIRTTASFGLAMLDADATTEESIDRCDTALLLAKSAGRNRVVIWDPATVTHRAFRKLDLDRITGQAGAVCHVEPDGSA